jgi:hypothetical protein
VYKRQHYYGAGTIVSVAEALNGSEFGATVHGTFKCVSYSSGVRVLSGAPVIVVGSAVKGSDVPAFLAVKLLIGIEPPPDLTKFGSYPRDNCQLQLD